MIDDDQSGSWGNLILIAAGAAALLFIVPHDVSGDGRVRYDALVDLLEHGKLTPTAYSLVGPLFSTPLYFLGKLFLGPTWWCSRYNALLLLAGLATTVSLLRPRVDRKTLHAFCLVMLAASMFPGHVLDYFGEVFTAILVLVGIAAVATEHSGFGWTAIVLGVINTPASIVGLLFVSVRHAFLSRKLRYLLPVLIAALLVIAESWIRRGGPFVSGYEGNAGARTVMPYSSLPGFSYPFFLGVLSILFSFGKGLLFFAPGLLLTGNCTRGREDALRECCRDLVWFLVGAIVVYAKWWSWYGGSFWGPRFFLIASVPASLAIALALQRRREMTLAALASLLAILTWSSWVGLNGPVFNQGGLRVCSENHYALEFLCWYTPEFSVLWRPFVAPPAALRWQQVAFATYCLVVFLWLVLPILREILKRTPVSGRRILSGWRF